MMQVNFLRFSLRELTSTNRNRNIVRKIGTGTVSRAAYYLQAHAHRAQVFSGKLPKAKKQTIVAKENHVAPQRLHMAQHAAHQTQAQAQS